MSTKSSTMPTGTPGAGGGTFGAHDRAARPPGGRRVRDARAVERRRRARRRRGRAGCCSAAARPRASSRETVNAPSSRSGLAPKRLATFATSAPGRAPTSHRPGSTDAARAPAAGSFMGRTAYYGAVSADAGEQSTAHPPTAAASPISFRTSSPPTDPLARPRNLRRLPTARAPGAALGEHRPTRPVRWSAAAAPAPGARSSVDRALASGARGHRFESCRAREKGPAKQALFVVFWRFQSGATALSGA